VDGRIILKWTLEKEGWRVWIRLSGWGQGLVMGCCEHGNEPLGSIKGGEFLGFEGVDWIKLTADRVQWWALMNALLVSSWVTVSFSRRILLHGVG
jgi:hypothetical protein